MDLNQIKQNYAQLPDFKIVNIANYEASQLPPEVIEILVNEIRIRNLPSTLLEAIRLTTRQLTDEELAEYTNLIRNLPDPINGDSTHQLNATTVSKTVSYIFFSQTTTRIFIGTPQSINKKLDEATLQTSLLGWWGLRSFFSAIGSLSHNSKMHKINYSGQPTEILTQFIKQNVGFIESNKKDRQKLIEFLNNAVQ